MPDLGTSLFNTETLTLACCGTNTLKSLPDHPSISTDSSLLSCPIETLTINNDCTYDFRTRPEIPITHEIAQVSSRRSGILKIRVSRMNSGVVDGSKKVMGGKRLEEYVKDWKDRKIASGVPENRCFLPFLLGSPRLAECHVCYKYIYPGDDVSCSVRGCQGIYHLKCAKDNLRCSILKKFKCPQHACFICKQNFFWRCVRCTVASHDKCAAWPEKVIHLSERPGWAVCWKHPRDWREEKAG